ncbi:MAG: long-chain fatty acid--CoA ligase [Nitrososphaerales archaeon]
MIQNPWIKFYPEGLQNLNYPAKPLFSLIDDNLSKYENKVIISYYGRAFTYFELFEYTNRFASSLIKKGYKKGDKLALFLPNTPQFIIAFFGALKAGLTLVPCNILYSSRELSYQLKDSSSKILLGLKDKIGERDFSKIMLDASKDINIEILFTGIQDFLEEPKGKAKNHSDFLEVIEDSPKEKPEVDINSRDLATILYTSGTTGKSKGVMLSHYNLLSNAITFAKWIKLSQEDVILGALPFFHSYGLTTSLNAALYSGSKVILMHKFNPLEAVELIEKQKVTVFCSVPTMLKAIVDTKASKTSLDSLRLCVSGASPLTRDIYDEFSRITKAVIVEGYGLSEASPVTHCNPINRTKFGSIGIPLPNTLAKVVSLEDFRDLGPNQIGELIVKGPQVMKGYYNLEEETKLALRDSWLFTGDLVKMDEEGYFYLIDRKKYMINVSGYKVYPKEVEDIIKEHKAIKEVAVVGVKHSYKGEAVKAYIVLREGYSLSRDEILNYCEDKLAKYKIPEEIEFVKDLPKSPIGKVMKEALIKR